MSIREAIKVCFQKYATFSGRARRSEYWFFFLFCLLVSIFLSILDMLLFDKGIFSVTIFGKPNAIGLSFIFSLVVLLPRITVTFRRLHDIGKSGWLCLPLFIINLILPFVDETWLETLANQSLGIAITLLVVLLLFLAYAILMLVWLCRDSEPDANRWGWNPKFSSDSNN